MSDEREFTWDDWDAAEAAYERRKLEATWLNQWVSWEQRHDSVTVKTFVAASDNDNVSWTGNTIGPIKWASSNSSGTYTFKDITC